MSGAFTVRSSTRRTDAGFLAIDDVVVDAPGPEVLHRVVVRHPGAVVVVPVEDDGAIAVCVRQFRAATGTEVLEVPAGKRDVDGESAETTAVRELEEELGLRAGRLVKLAEFWNTPGFSDEYTHLYAALDLVAGAPVAPSSAEEREMTVERVALADVEYLVASGELRDAKTIIGLLLARSFLAGDHPGLRG